MRQRQNIWLRGTAISPGMAMGRAFIYHDVLEQHVQREHVEPRQAKDEYRRLEEALAQAAAEMALSAERVEQEVSSALADILRAHRQIIMDPYLREELRREVLQNLASAESAVWYIFRQWEQKIRDLGSKTFPQRCDDISDSRRRVLNALQGIETHALEQMPQGCVLVAHRLLPSDAVFFTVRRPAGIVVESGSPGSHCALLSRGMGIPGVVQLPDIVDTASEDQLILVDGLRGRVIIGPDRHTRARFETEMKKYHATLVDARKHSHRPAITTDGVEISVMANVGNRQDAELAAENGADGIGLYRTEVLFTSRRMLPSEDELVEEMDSVLSPFEGRPVVVRLLDIGGDKNLPYLDLGSEPNPFLGRRGVRVLLDFPKLLDTQLQALLRLSHTQRVRIIVPMVTLAEDMRRIRDALHSVAGAMGVREVPPLGAMLETPGAVLCVREIMKYADFVSVGTNDLTQYTMAAGRDSPFVSRYFQDNHPALLELLRMACEGAGETQVAVCGELAGRLDCTEALVRSGVRMLSVAPAVIPPVKQAVRRVSVSAHAPSGTDSLARES